MIRKILGKAISTRDVNVDQRQAAKLTGHPSTAGHVDIPAHIS